MDALRHGNFRFATLLSVICLGLAVAGCSGDDGDDGAPGATGATGDTGLACWDLNENGVPDLPDEDLNGDGVVDVLDCNALANQPDADVEAAIAASKPESCDVCHSGAGEDHQAIYEKYVDDSNLALTFTAADITVVPNGAGFNVTVQFELSNGDGTPVDRTAETINQLRFYTVRYDVALGGYYDSCSLGDIVNVDAANGVYTATNDFDNADPNRIVICAFDPTATDSQVYGYAARIPLVQHEGGTGAEIPDGSHVHLYDDAANTAVAFGAAAADDPDSYESAANVAGCARCHGTPYLKHGYRAAEVDGLPDFAACKSCHYDDRNGGHEDWQWMVDDPFAWATTELGAAEEAKYAYTANIMNDVHMAHAMEFPYPQSMSNCVVCHDDKLDQILTDENFTAETCKSCHPVDGVDAWPGDLDDEGSQYYQEGRAPALAWIWETEDVGFHTIDADCTICHSEAGGFPTFSEIHSGYDAHIYDADGVRYSDTYTLSIDGVDVDLEANTMTVTFSANDPVAISPQVLVSFYGWNTRQYIVPSHTRDGDRLRYECSAKLYDSSSCSTVLFPSLSGTGTAADPWVLGVDLAAWGGTTGQNATVPELIADGSITKAEVTVLGRLSLDSAPEAGGLNAVAETIELATGAPIENYYKGTAKLVDEDGCNDCHEQLAVTFHGNGASNVQACRNCHNPTYRGSHLEMASRSIENYVHTIHSFQDFDTDDIFGGGISDLIPGYDPVYAKRYDQHIKHVFPNFTINNCEACHVEGSYNVPDQAESMPGLLSELYMPATWYGVYPEDDPLEGKTFEDPAGRGNGLVTQYVTGPASRACGGCHRARLINQEEFGALAAWNSHTGSFGTYVPDDYETDAEGDRDYGNNVLFGVINKIMSMF